MIEAALKFFRDLADQAATPVKLDAHTPGAVRYVVKGEVVTIDESRPWREHRVGTLTDLIEATNAYGALENPTNVKPVVWFNEAQVVAVLDDDTERNDRITFALAHSDLFKSVMAMRTMRPGTHKEFYRFIKIGLRGAGGLDALVASVRMCKFDTGGTARNDLGRNRESLGKEITAAVNGVEDIPEEVTLLVPVYQNPGEAESYPVRCAVDIEPLEQTFRLVPFPDEVERAVGLALDSVRERLSLGLVEGTNAYNGKP